MQPNFDDVADAPSIPDADVQLADQSGDAEEDDDEDGMDRVSLLPDEPLSTDQSALAC